MADSRVNPLNWFGTSQAAQAAPQSAPQSVPSLVDESRRTRVVDARGLVETVDSLTIERTPTGAIVRAVGTAETQGFYNAQLVNTGVSNGVLTLQFRAAAPAGLAPAGAARSRQITTAYVIDMTTLAAVQTVRIEAAQNARSARR